MRLLIAVKYNNPLFGTVQNDRACKRSAAKHEVQQRNTEQKEHAFSSKFDLTALMEQSRFFTENATTHKVARLRANGV